MTTRKPPKSQKPIFFEKGGKPSFSKGKKDRQSSSNSQLDSWLYGDHAVLAALSNPDRKIRRLLLTKAKLDKFESHEQNLIHKSNFSEFVTADELKAVLPDQAIHQGIALLSAPLKEVDIEDIPEMVDESVGNAVAILDQVTDPHNVGAILRSAAAFNIVAIICPDRHTPPITGVLARSASGAVETVPIVRVGNLSRAMDRLAEMGFWRIGMDGRATQSLEQAIKGSDRLAIVLGSEGKGLRRLTSEKCDLLGKLPMSDSIESLNVSNAAAIAFYEINRANQGK